MHILNVLFTLVIFVLIISYGTGILVGGPDKANKLIIWELKQLSKFGRWLLKHLFQAFADLFGALAKACGPKKKQKKP